MTTHSPTLRSRYLRHSSFSKPSVASPTSQFILQPFFRFSYVTSSSLNSPGEPPPPHVCMTVILKLYEINVLGPFQNYTIDMYKLKLNLTLRPGADQSSKAAFCKSAFAKTCFLLLKIWHGAHQSSKKQKFWHVLAESILLVALGQTIAFWEVKMLCLKANLFREKALLPKVNLLLANALLQKAALLDWSAPSLRVHKLCCSSRSVEIFTRLWDLYTGWFSSLRACKN